MRLSLGYEVDIQKRVRVTKGKPFGELRTADCRSMKRGGFSLGLVKGKKKHHRWGRESPEV